MHKDSIRWRVRSDTNLAWRDWHDESVIFDTLSGDTHLLDMVAATGLRRLEERWYTVESLAATLADDLGERLDDNLRQYTSRLIELLSSKGMLDNNASDSP